MFGFLAGLMAGEHETLVRRPRTEEEAITWDPQMGGFVASERLEREPSTWLGRGEVPGQPRAEAAGAAGETVAEETRALVEGGRPGRGGDGAGGVQVAGPAVPAKDRILPDRDLVAREHRVEHNRSG